MVETMTDEEVMMSLQAAMCSPNCPGYDKPSCPDCYKGKAMDYLHARLAQKPKITREQVKEFIPCTCLPEYKDRDIKDPYCAYHSENWEGLLLALGLEVEEEK
jgi:hypothetical protein